MDGGGSRMDANKTLFHDKPAALPVAAGDITRSNNCARKKTIPIGTVLFRTCNSRNNRRPCLPRFSSRLCCVLSARSLVYST